MSCESSLNTTLGAEPEAKRIYFRLQELFIAHPNLSLEETKELAKVVIGKINTTKTQDSRDRLLHLIRDNLGTSRDVDLSDLFNKYLVEKERSNTWKASTAAYGKNTFSLLQDLLGDLPINLIKKTTALRVKEDLQKLPAHSAKRQRYKGKSANELTQLAIPPSELMSIKTINMKLSLYSEVFSWATTH